MGKIAVSLSLCITPEQVKEQYNEFLIDFTGDRTLLHVTFVSIRIEMLTK